MPKESALADKGKTAPEAAIPNVHASKSPSGQAVERSTKSGTGSPWKRALEQIRKSNDGTKKQQAGKEASKPALSGESATDKQSRSFSAGMKAEQSAGKGKTTIQTSPNGVQKAQLTNKHSEFKLPQPPLPITSSPALQADTSDHNKTPFAANSLKAFKPLDGSLNPSGGQAVPIDAQAGQKPQISFTRPQSVTDKGQKVTIHKADRHTETSPWSGSKSNPTASLGNLVPRRATAGDENSIQESVQTVKANEKETNPQDHRVTGDVKAQPFRDIEKLPFFERMVARFSQLTSKVWPQCLPALCKCSGTHNSQFWQLFPKSISKTKLLTSMPLKAWC